MSESREIPNGWAIASVQDIAEVIMGQSPPSSTYNKDKIGLPFFQGKAEFTELHPVAEKWCCKPNKSAINNDILISVRAPVGAINIADRECCIGRGLAAIRYHRDHKFIYYYFRLIEKELDEKGTGTTFRAISGDVIKKTKLSLPPLSEQHRIVAKIEELFSSLDKGIESLKTAQQQLKVYRQAVLKWAFEGKLTNKNVVEGKLPEGWKWVRLNTVCNKIQDGSHFSPKIQYDEPGENRFPYITAKNIRNNYMDFSKLTYVDREFHESIYERCNPEYGDVLLTKDGVNTGEVTLNSLKEAFSLLSSVCIFKTKRNELDSGFLKYFIQSPLGSRAVSDSMTGTAIKRIILRKIKEAEIIQPPLPEQHAIVAEIESRLSVCDKIEESIEHSLKQSEALRQSILKKAFEGKLVRQDPNDEPASVLLERIKAEREENKPENPPRR